MSQHQTDFTTEKALPAAKAAPGLTLPQEPAALADHPEPSRRRRLRPLLLTAVAIAALAGAADFGWHCWMTGRFAVATDDAYVKADSTTIAPKISGYIAAVLVGDNETVRAGQVLARVDDRDFKVSLAQAGAQVEAAQANIATRQAALAAQSSAIDATRATLEADKADETFAEQNNDRYAQLAKSGYGSIQNAQLATSRIGIARAAVTRDTAALASAVRQLDVIKAELAQAQAALDGAKAAQDQAALNLSYTVLVAPVDGVVGNRSLRVGQYVQAGTQLMAVVPTDAAYIVANYKETQLTAVRAGQTVTVEVDTYPGQVFHGRVDSLSPASGQEFALLPPDNATGNFTKVVQRIPVKIVLDRQGPLPVVLRPGMSVYPRIDTRPHATEIAQASGRIN